MFCPVCGDEYREGYERCADCDVLLVEAPPPQVRRGDEEDDDLHRLVPVLTSADRGVLAAALGRLDAMRLPHSDPELPRQRGPGTEDALPEPVQILVARGLREEAERCLVGVEESLEALNRDMERHGFPAGEEEIPLAEIRYCPRCGQMHHGFSSCVDCGVPLVAALPDRPEAQLVWLLSTLDVEKLAAVRRRLARAGIPFEWGRLIRGDVGGPQEPRPSPLIPAGWVYVTVARLREARKALGNLSGVAVATVEDEEDAAEEASAAAGEEAFEESAEHEEGDGDNEIDDDDHAEGTLYCPRCRGEYRAGFTRCADCGVALVERLPAAARRRTRATHDPREARCVSCGALLPSAMAVCPRCSPPDEDEELALGDAGDPDDADDAGATMISPAAIAAPTGSTASITSAPADTWWALSTGLPNARADHRRIQALYRSARFTAWCGLIVLPWITQPVAFRQASQALALMRSYGAGEHPLEQRIERLRWFAFAYGAAAWLALAAWLVERRPF
jgi:hypothetical protein